MVELADGATLDVAMGTGEEEVIAIGLLDVVERAVGELVVAKGASVEKGAIEGSTVVTVGSIEGISLGELSNVGSKDGIIVEIGFFVTGAFVGRRVGLLVGQVLHTVIY